MNKRIPSEIAIGIILLVAIIIGGLIWLGDKKQEKNVALIPLAEDEFKKEDNIISNSDVNKKAETKTNLFYATNDDNKIIVNIFDSNNNTILNSKTITSDDILGFSSNSAVGANYAVQFNSQTKDVLFLTNGSSPYDGSCMNKDGTCFDRIYKINIDDTKQKPKIIFQTKDFIQNWIVNPEESSVIVGINILVNEMGSDKLVLKSINLSSGAVKTITENASAGEDLVLSSDAKYLFQVIGGDKLVLNRINVISGDIEKIDIYNGRISLSEAYVSPNGRFAAFHQSGLKIYDVANNKMISHSYSGKIANFGLNWSGDSEKLTYILDNKIAYHDIVKDIDITIEQGAGYVYGWAPSNQYIIYTSNKNSGVKFYDTFENKNAEFNEPIFSNSDIQSIVGMNWF